MTILAVNAGSSTLKFALYKVNSALDGSALMAGSVDGLSSTGSLRLECTVGGVTHAAAVNHTGVDRFDCALQALQQLIAREFSGVELQAVAHRVVHGGGVYHHAVRVDAQVLEQLAKFSPLAPLHQVHNIAGIRAFSNAFPSLPQIACFDTAFHSTLPELEYSFALPAGITDQGVRRYGFHGLSYQYVLGKLGSVSQRARGRVVMAHLGSGASLCGTYQGESRATSMGFSALDGLMMGTRSGALDPGVILHLLAQGWDHQKLENLLYRQSGLMGVSGISGDMRSLRASEEKSALLAVQMFTYRVIREAGAVVACLGGMDALVFTGGIGEHDAILRAEVCRQLSYLGVVLDTKRNEAASPMEAARLDADGSLVEVWMVPTDEGRVAAQLAFELLQ
jgi:acetate kinase